ncbi:uncharacterized abhydrolase domain-containing protein DDB_G0269086 [Drosophila navojoa]|uniref:uncharacterized abhydrolase domain-containing protein DDB_G0269086 n=1 Tax=Drosophila navojoa TaxID=7232 RepID=UPI0011BD621E|nr:uncharacterized abhydrolase domain-containing protein DDB_G0269086 [Drosophila navojoa]
MHRLVCLLATLVAASWSLAAGSTLRPIIKITRTAAPSVQRGYQEQDTARAFYSYGYSDENAARAEYTALDGTSRGFYSYVDPNGELQTVKYEAGGRDGFKAEGTNLPKAPVDDKKPPLPVSDTAEVQEARKAHLSAIREAQKNAEKQQQQEEQQEEEQEQSEEQRLSDEDADILERVRAELTSMLAERQRGEAQKENQKAKAAAAEENNNRQSEQEREPERERERKLERERKTEPERERTQTQAIPRSREQRLKLSSDANDQRLRTVYSLEDLRSSSYLKLSDLSEDRQDVRVPVSAYYSYVSPDAKYSVTTPTELRTLRPVALSRSLVLTKRN